MHVTYSQAAESSRRLARLKIFVFRRHDGNEDWSEVSWDLFPLIPY